MTNIYNTVTDEIGNLTSKQELEPKKTKRHEKTPQKQKKCIPECTWFFFKVKFNHFIKLC